jgi:signal transduction histidine kinase
MPRDLSAGLTTGEAECAIDWTGRGWGDAGFDALIARGRDALEIMGVDGRAGRTKRRPTATIINEGPAATVERGAGGAVATASFDGFPLFEVGVRRVSDGGDPALVAQTLALMLAARAWGAGPASSAGHRPALEIALDARGCIAEVSASAATLIGWSAEELRGVAATLLCRYPETVSKTTAALAADGVRALVCETELISSAGDWVALRVLFSAADAESRSQAAPLLAENTPRPGVMEPAEKRMVLGALHDLAGYMSALTLTYEALDADGCLSALPQDDRETMRDLQQRVARSIHDLRVRLAVGAVRARRAVVDDTLRGSANVLRRVAHPASMHLELGSADLLTELRDEDLMRILQNLVSNAREAAGPGGRVWIRTAVCMGQRLGVCIEVEDDGPMVPAENAERIFEEGFSTRGGAIGSRGLGLAVVGRLVREAGGRFALDQTEARKRFVVQLPATLPEDEPLPRGAS